METEISLMKNRLGPFILHMPHTGTEIPCRVGYAVSDDVLLREMNRVTDWGVPEIFSIQDVTTIRPKFSRLFCDVERFYDAGEPLSDYPFAGTLIPAGYYGNKQTFGMMIEINRKLYQNKDKQEPNKETTAKLNKQIQTAIKQIAQTQI
jgi:N-formylglutamate amidohydrolase